MAPSNYCPASRLRPLRYVLPGTKTRRVEDAPRWWLPVRTQLVSSVEARTHVTVNAYILIQTEVGKAAQVSSAIAKLPGVTQAEDVTGPYDVIVRAEAATVDELGKLVVANVQTVPGITRTLTCPVVHL
jgi:DNA-binding Lrp family transcriptional regulator